MLRADGIEMSFGGLKALDGVSVELNDGQTLGVIGPNGSGKSTLVNVLTGFLRPDKGRVELDGKDLTGLPPAMIRREGLARTFQNLRLYNELTVLENVLIGLHLTFEDSPLSYWRWIGAMFGTPSSRRRERHARERAMECLDAVHLADKADEQVGKLSYGDHKRLELARATAVEPVVLVLDEPTAGMNPAEAHELMHLFSASVAGESGRSLLLIEHRLELVLEVCDRVAVLDGGRKIADGLPNDIANDPRVLEVYVGGSG